MRRWGYHTLVSGLLLLSCTGFDLSPFASENDCVGQFCNQGVVSGINAQAGAGGTPFGTGGLTGAGGLAGVGGIVEVAGFGGSGGAITQACPIDATSGVPLCVSLPSCPGFAIDVTTFPACGLSAVPQGIELDCVCNGSQICTIGFAATCGDLPRLFNASSVADLCNQAVTTLAFACRDLGSGRFGGFCDRNCAASCANNPTCLRACGC